jgi:arylsulfatase A-like enzyme
MHIADLYPTLLNLAGASLKQKLPLDGMDILPCLTEGKPSPREEILLNTTPNNGALRMGDWKLVFRSNQGGEDAATAAEKKAKKKKRAVAPAGVELFNLAEDPFEKHDLSASHPEKLKALRSRYEALAAQAITPKNLQE